MSTTTEHPIYEAVRFLAGRCDHAMKLDGVGFNKFDSDFGHKLADLPPEAWSPQQRRAAYEMIEKYRGQLAEAGIDYDSLPEPPEPDESTKADRRIYLSDDGDRWWIDFPYDPDLVAAVKEEVPGRSFDGDTKRWHAPANAHASASLMDFADDHGFVIEERERAAELGGDVRDFGPRFIDLEDGEFAVRFPYDRELKDRLKDEVPGAQWDPDDSVWRVPLNAARELAAWAEGRFEITDEANEVIKEAANEAVKRRALSDAEREQRLEVEDRLGGTLRPFQRAGVRYALDAERTFICDEMGLGKTIQALAAVEARKAYPTVAVVPASVKENWAREARKWLPDGRRVEVLEGIEPCDTAADFIVLNYAILGHREGPEDFPWVERLLSLEPEAVILDESHKVKNRDANRSEAARRLSSAVEMRLLLTGTPVLNRPIEIWHQLQVLGRAREVGGNWKRFVKRYCDGRRGEWGWEVDGASNVDELNERLRATCYVRRQKKDVLEELPDKQRTRVPVELSNREEYDEARRDLIRWLKENRGKDEASKASRAEQLARFNYLKQVAARGKLDAAASWIEDFLESGEKLVVFAHHREIQEALYEAFEDRAVRITGGMAGGRRQAAVDAFQHEDDVRLMVGSLQAAGVGITLTAASNVAFIELGWTPADHDQAEDRVHRIGQNEAVNAWYLLAEDTIDDEVWALIERKRHVVDRTTEGGDSVQDSVFGELVDSVLEEADDAE